MSKRARTNVEAGDVKQIKVIHQGCQAECNSSRSSPPEYVVCLQRSVGNRAVQRLFESGITRAKLRMGQSNDIYEQEADRAAAHVMRMPEPASQAKPTWTNSTSPCREGDVIRPKRQPPCIAPLVQRQVENQDEEVQTSFPQGATGRSLHRQVEKQDDETVQTKAFTSQTGDPTTHLESGKILPGGGGEPLPTSVRTLFESRFGLNSVNVRLHSGVKAAESARVLNARAYTVGMDIVFGEGQYTPETNEGRRLLAHELTHVVQQTGRTRRLGDRVIQRTGAEAAQAARSFPPNIAFGRMQQGRGILANPRYWTVEYILQNPRLRRQSFVNSATYPAVWPQARTFLRGNPRWQTNDTSLFVVIRIGSHGASAAINDLWNPRSTGSYAFECYTAASLVELRGIYLTYRQTNRTEADFDRDYNSFVILHTPQGGLTNLEPSVMETLPDQGIPMNTTEYQRRLRQGDWVYIRNPNIRGAWAGENAVYLGGDQFFGHGLGIFTPQTYAARLLRRVRQSSERPSPMPTSDEILRGAHIVPYGRPLR